MAQSIGNTSTHVFVVEDDNDMRHMVGTYLDKQGMRTTLMASAEEMLRRIHQTRPDLILLDVSLPGQTGLQACQSLRTQGDRIPIILLTARSEEFDRVLGLEMGADDYISKPFSPRELLARIRAVMRRAVNVPGSFPANTQAVPLGQAVFEPSARRLVWPKGASPEASGISSEGEQQVRTLTTVEFALLSELCENPRVPLSRERLLACAHGQGSPFLPRTVDVAIMRLRKLVEPDPARPRFIQSVRNFGYVFVPQSEGEAG